MAPPDLAHVEDWVFDLDNTLYPAECDLFAEIDARMTDFVARFLRVDHHDARTLQKQYYAAHGTTLKGLMTLHGMQPDDFLHHVHEIDLSPLPISTDLRSAIAALPGRKFVYTNGSRRHARRVTEHMQLADLFDGMFAIEDADFHPKPDPRSYEAFCARFEITPHRAVLFEDMTRNLAPADAIGFATVLVTSSADWADHEPDGARPARQGDDHGDHIHYVTDDLTGFLRSLLPTN